MANDAPPVFQHPQPPPVDLMGQDFGRFVLFDKIGVGGMGNVFVGFDPQAQDLVALKTLLPEYNDDERAVQRFQREAALYSKMAHPNVVGFVEAGQEQGLHYIALEYVRGRSLADIILRDRKNVLTFERVINLVIEVAKGLRHVHELEILHRDIKPANIILTQDDTVKLIDFGIALAEDGMDLTGTGMILGTFVYSSPEQNQGRLLDERSDLYALGCVFFEMLTGQRALPGATMTEVAKFQALPKLASASNFNPAVPPELDRIIDRLLKPRPRDRYQCAEELIGELVTLKKAFKGGSPPTAPGTSPKPPTSPGIFGDEVDEAWELSKEAFTLGHVDQALEQAVFYSAQRPTDPRVHFMLGKLYVIRRDQHRAIEAFAQALALAPSNDQYRLDFALALYRLDQFPPAIELLEQVLSREPQNGAARGIHLIAQLRRDDDAQQAQAAQEQKRARAGLDPIAAAVEGMAPPPGFGPPPEQPSEQPSEQPPEQPPAPAPGVPEPRMRSLRETVPYPAFERASASDENDEAEGGGLRQTFAEGAATFEQNVTATNTWADLRSAGRAQILSSILPGLGHLLHGRVGEFVARLLWAVVLVGCAAELVFLHVLDTDFRVDDLAATIAPEALDAARAVGLQALVNDNRQTWLLLLSVIFCVLYLVHWSRSRRAAYLFVLRKAMKGKILHVREDGTVKLNVGSLRGVELGQRFRIVKTTSAKEYSANTAARTVQQTLSAYAIANAQVVKVRRNTSVAEWKALGGETARPEEGDKVEPIE